jgi:phosphinothricin acetyltransferase
VPVHEAVIREASEADMEAVAGIFGHYARTSVATFETAPHPVAHWTRLREDLAERGLPFLVCEVSGEVAGYAYATPWRPKPAYRRTVENSVYLAPGFSGRGLGGSLLRELRRACAAAGLEQMIAVIAVDPGGEPPASLFLHRACGFAEAGRLRGVGRKHGLVLDTLLLQCDLTAV